MFRDMLYEIEQLARSITLALGTETPDNFMNPY